MGREGKTMKRTFASVMVALLLALTLGCGGGVQRPEKWEISLAPTKEYTGAAKGVAVIDTKTGTDVTINISGLEAGKIYTVFFVNVASKMFEGVGKEPFTLPVDGNGVASLKATIKKNAFERFTKLGIFLNPGTQPLANPLGVDATLGPLVTMKKPTMILEGKLR
jgi:hypothetical protein